jgi:hypothetical protein
MWPWTHAALGYLLYTGLTRVRSGTPPGDVATLWLLLGTQLPDLIDKPLAWTFDLVPSGRMLAHTLFVAVPACWLVHRYWRRRGNPEYGVAFGVGYLSHVLSDAIGSVLVGDYAYARFLVWPLLSVPEDQQEGILQELAMADPTLSPALAIQTMGGLGIVALWVYDGAPGAAVVRRLLDRIRER